MVVAGTALHDKDWALGGDGRRGALLGGVVRVRLDRVRGRALLLFVGAILLLAHHLRRGYHGEPLGRDRAMGIGDRLAIGDTIRRGLRLASQLRTCSSASHVRPL